MRKRILVITGVPGTGKTSFSNRLAKELPGSEIVHVTEVVNEKRLFRKKAGEKVADMGRLQAELERRIALSAEKNVVLESHLLCDLKLKDANVLVLREHLVVLYKRLSARRYARAKINANIISEATDYCGIRADRNYARVFEAFSSDKRLVAYARKLLDGNLPKGRPIDLLPEFDTMLRRNRSLLR